MNRISNNILFIIFSSVFAQGECPQGECPPLFGHEQSTLQAFYFVNTILINNNQIEVDDWIGAFHGDKCIGARQWDTSLCGGGVCDIPAMGDDGSEYTDEYINPGDTPTFKVYDSSAGIYYDLVSDIEICEWVNFGFCSLDILYYESDIDIPGCMNEDACNYNSEATEEDGSCVYSQENFDCEKLLFSFLRMI